MTIGISRLRIGQVGLSTIAAGGAGMTVALAAAASTFAPLVAVVGLALGYLLLVSPEAAILLTLLVRPLLDLAPQGLAVPSFAQQLDLSAAVALLLAGAGAIYVFVNRVEIFRIPLMLPFVALLTVATASIVSSNDPGVTVVSLVRLSSQVAIFVLVFSMVRSWAQAERFVLVIVAAAIAPVLWGFGQILTGNAEFLGPGVAEGIDQPRLAGPFGPGLTLGTFLIAPLVIVVTLVFESRRHSERLAYVGVLALLMFSFYLTLARAAWLGFGLALGVLGVARYRVLLVLAPLVLAVALLLVPAIGQRWTPIFQDPAQTSVAGRVDLWRGAWSVFSDNPILGAGLGISDVEAGLEARDKPARVHGDYLRVLADTGLLGLGAYLWLLGAAGIEAVRSHRRLTTPRYRAIALTFLAVWAGFMVVRVSGNVLTHQVFNYYFWSLAAVALALPGLEATEKQGEADAGKD